MDIPLKHKGPKVPPREGDEKIFIFNLQKSVAIRQTVY